MIRKLSERKRERMCERKHQHTSRRLAQDHIERLKHSPTVTAPERLHIYLCPLTGKEERHLHVGHRTQREQRRLELEGLL